MSESEHETGRENEEENEDLASILSSIAPEGDERVETKIYKIEQGKPAWVTDAHATDADTLLGNLREDFGPGQYEAYIRVNGRIAKRHRFAIAGTAKRKEPEKSTDTNGELIRMVVEGQKSLADSIYQLGQLVVNQNNQQPQTQIDPFAMQRDTIALMVQMKELFSDGGNRGNSHEDFLKGIEFAKEIAGETLGDNDPSPGAVLMKVADKLAPTLEKLLSSPKIQPRPVAGKMPVPPAAQHPQRRQTPQPQQPQQEQNEMSIMMMAMKPQIKQLAQYAANGMTPDQLAEPVLDAIPDLYLDTFETFIRQLDAVKQMETHVPEVGPHRVWFHKLRERIIYLLDDEEETDELTGEDFEESLENETDAIEGEVLTSEETESNLGHHETDTDNGNADGDTHGGRGDAKNP